MKITGKWIAAATMVLLAAGVSLPAAAAQACDPASLTCYASAAPDRARDASFLDLVRQGETRSLDAVARQDSLAQPVAYVATAARPPSPENMAPAGVGVLDSAMGTQLANGGGEPAWLALPKSIAAPDSSVAWIFALGFLGFVILRRVRAAPSY